MRGFGAKAVERILRALVYFTGSKAHNIALRSLAAKRGWKLSEYGLFEGRKQLAGRVDGGEIEAARAGTLPRLVALDDIRGDLHCHTNATDGADPLEAMARAAEERGCFLEVNAQPKGRDLADAHKLVKRTGGDR